MAKQISELKLGILGGGQLGRMLIQQAINYNVNSLVLDPDPDAPCKHIANYFENGSITDFDTVYNFGKKADIITIEIEKVNIEALEQLEKEGKQVFPQSRVIRLIQDKGVQKQFFKENDIPTSPFQIVNTKEDMENSHIPFPYILKLRKDGYDGKGVMKINTAADLDKAFDAPCVLEKKVDIDKELSFVVARNPGGETKAFPAVELVFHPEYNLVEHLFSPANIDSTIEKRGEAIAMKLANELELVGLLAVEMFLDRQGNLLVNEIAPRPHNSGHQTIEGNLTSQFEQHLRAILGMPLGATDTVESSVMVNLLGAEGHKGSARYEGMQEVLAMHGVYPHLYGKAITKPGRKMGHVTIVDSNLNKALETAELVKSKIKVVSDAQ